MPDYPNLLNNLLQGLHVAAHFSYTFDQEGPGDKTIHIVTAMFRNTAYGVGRGTSKGAAKQGAAQEAYNHFMANGVPEA